MSLGSEMVKTKVVNGVEVEIYGCWDEETPENKFDFFELFVDGECINLGVPYHKVPSTKTIRRLLESQRV